jgi:YcxB-like protein
MQFNGRINEMDLKEVQKLTRRKSVWLRPLIGLRTLYGVGLLVAIGWATVEGLLGRTKPNWQAVSIIWLVIAALFVWSVYSAKQGRAKMLTQLNSVLADQVILANDGVKMDGPNGATRFLPWTNFKGWREGSRTILLDQTQANQFVILPVARLSELECQRLRGLLQSQIPVAR